MNYYIQALRKYAVFEGRARRMEYWMFTLFNFLIFIVIFLVGLVIGISDFASGLITVYYLAMVIPHIAVGVRRLHDTGHSGWWLLIGFVPLVGVITLLVFLIIDSQSGENKYGSNPKGKVISPVVPTT